MASAGFASSCSFPCILRREVRYGNRITADGAVQTAVCGIDIFCHFSKEPLKYKGKIDVEKSVGNVDNSLKTRLLFFRTGPFDRFRRRKLWKVNAKKRRKSGRDFWQNSVLTYKNFPMGKAAACSFALHITNCNILFPVQQKPLDITLKNR